MKFQHPNIKSTKTNNMYHLLYIGTREGVELNEDIKEFNNDSENKDYLKYIANRPRSHGLFGKEKDIDIQKLANEMKEYNGYVYRGIVSLREEDAVSLGYDKKDKWETLIKARMLYISKQLNIPYSNLKWVGAFHRESGHPHIHLMIWNGKEEVRAKGAISKENLEGIRKNLTNEIFKEERERILLEKNLLRELLIEGTKGSQNKDFSKFEELEEKFADIDIELKGEAEELNDYKIGTKITNKFMKKIEKLIDKLEVPKTGRLQYKLMTPEVKKDIDKITDKILENPSYKIYFEKYMDSIEKLTRMYTDNPEDIKKAKDNAKEDIYSRIGNSILKTKRTMIFEQRKAERESNQKSFVSKCAIQSMLMNTFKILSAKTNRNENTKQTFSRTTAQKKQMAKKMKAKGLYSDRDLGNEI